MARTRATPSFSQLVDLFIEDRRAFGKSPRALEFYAFALKRFVEWAEATGARPDRFGHREYTAYLAALQKEGRRAGNNQKHSGQPLKPRSVHAFARSVRALLRYAGRAGYLDIVPDLEMPKTPTKRPRWLEDNEVQTVLAACQTERELALFSMLIDSGLRRAEVSSLVWGDFIPREDTVDVIVRAGKGEKARTTFLSMPAWETMKAYRATVGNDRPQDPVWVGQDGTPLTPEGIRAIVDRLSRRSGIKFTPHSLRHTAGRRAAERGMQQMALMDMFGWSPNSLSLLSHYTGFNTAMTRRSFASAYNGAAR
jgi:integrase/recombinase XerD